jgi:hypothetical protein
MAFMLSLPLLSSEQMALAETTLHEHGRHERHQLLHGTEMHRCTGGDMLGRAD